MQIIVGKTAGFCFGVKNAVTKAEEELKKGEEVYCLGELVHNNQVTKQLINDGMNFIEDVKQAKNKVIIRSHGVEKSIYEEAKNRNLQLVDLTCPKVLKIHNIAEEYSEKGYYIFLIGNKAHPEIIGTASFCGNNYTIIENLEDIDIALKNAKESNIKEILIIAQTTYSLAKFNEIVEKIKENAIQNLKIEVKNTICNATKERQEETANISKQVEAMIIIGGKHSSNSNKLYELSKKYCQNVFFIETLEEIDLEQFRGINTIGVMAGASTPEKSINEVVEKLSKV